MAMPSYQKEIVKWLGGVVLTVGTLTTLGHFFLPEIDASLRGPASLNGEANSPPALNKDHILKAVARDGLAPDGKGSAAVRIEIRSSESTPNIASQQVGKPIQLQAYIQATRAQTGLRYAWRIPRGVVVTEGEVNGELGDLNQGETRMLSLTITTSTEENRQIHLNVFRQDGDENLGDVAQYNTAPQGPSIKSMVHLEPVLKAESRSAAPKLIQ